MKNILSDSYKHLSNYIDIKFNKHKTLCIEALDMNTVGLIQLYKKLMNDHQPRDINNPNMEYKKYFNYSENCYIIVLGLL